MGRFLQTKFLPLAIIINLLKVGYYLLKKYYFNF